MTAMSIFSNVGEIEDGMRTLSPPHAIVDADDAAAPEAARGAVDYEDVRFGYGRPSAALDGFTLHVRPGERVALVGRSGAGKTTAVSLLLRLYEVEGGRILLDGADIRDLTQDALRAQVGMVRQETALFNRSALENIRYGRPGASDEEVHEAARRAEAHDFILDLRDWKGRTGYDAHLGERGVKLSGGQRQRIALARVILKDAPVLVLDEATAALDSEVEAAIQDTLDVVMEGKTVDRHRASPLDDRPDGPHRGARRGPDRRGGQPCGAARAGRALRALLAPPVRRLHQPRRRVRAEGDLAMTDIATRVWDHAWRIDPIVRSLLDTDFYKLLMLQTVCRRHRDVTVEVQPDQPVEARAARQADRRGRAARPARPHPRLQADPRRVRPGCAATPSTASAGCSGRSSWPGSRTSACPSTGSSARGDQYELTFEGSWPEAMMWEIPALAVLMELRSRAVLHDMGKFELRVLYARATPGSGRRSSGCGKLPDLAISDFGTRRRHSFLWQDWALQAMIEGLGDRFTGSSNCLIAMRRDIEAIGTNAHELPMVYAALAEDDAALAEAPYEVLENWHAGLRRQPPDHPARHLRHQGLPRARARVAGLLDRHPHRLPACPRRGRRPRSPGGRAAARTRARSSSSSPTASTSTGSRRSTPASTAG